MKNLSSKIVALALGVALSHSAVAGGPLELAGPGGTTPVVYPSGGVSISINLDQGALGSRTKAQADALLTQAMALWTNVSTATVTLNRGPDLPVDVTVSNYLNYYGKYSDGLNPVIYDSDGSITDALFGVGAKGSILGFAGSAYNVSSGTYTEGEAVINGAYSISDNTLVVVLAHELGHFIGLDHTQLDNSQGLASSNYALMYPIAYRSVATLHEDEVAAVSALYPTADVGATYGTLTGNFLQVNNSAILGANIWAQETSTGKVYSCVSDYRKQGTGYYRMLLPAGTYTLHAESIESGFTGGSSVGPYSATSSSASFTAPHPITPVAYQASTPGSTATFKIVAGCAANITFKLDGSGALTSSTCTNTPPVAQNGSVSTPSSTPVAGTAVATDANGDALTYRIVTNGTKGTATINSSTGAFTYTPNANVTGADSFTFVANDGGSDSNLGTISVTITNRAPVITSLTATPTTLLDTATSQLQVSATDSDGPSALSYTWTVLSGGGTLSNTTIANPIYTPPNVASSTSVTLNVAVSDGTAITNQTLSLTVNDAGATGSDTVWVEDALPVGASTGGDSEAWTWVNASPTPFSGSLAHQSALVSGEHQHYFYGASSLFSINTGDTLFAYVYLDPSAPPTEVMLQWHDASNGWEHRAYWGGNTIPFGTDGTTSRKYMGALPAAGGWVRLNVPASAVGLEGISIDGMAFTLWNGRATWDKAGKTTGAVALGISTTSLASGNVGTAYTQTVTATGGATPYTWSISSGALPAGLSLNASTGVISGTPTATGTSNFTLRVQDNAAASTTQNLSITINAASSDTVWVEDALPVGASTGGDSEAWTWVNASPTPFSGSLAHQSALVSGEHQHYFYGASSLFSINTGDTLFAYVYLDPSAPPTEVMLQWHDASNGWEHRAYWGGNTIPFGTDGTTSRKYMGALPAAGGWVRLNVPASAVGLEGISIDGMAFTLWNGRATWDKAGKTTGAVALGISTTSLASGNVGTAYTQTVTATGGATPYTWSISSGALPAGLSLNASTGVISGTPTATGTSNFTLRVQDNAAASTTQNLSITINAASSDTVWVEDALPAGASTGGDSEAWTWVNASPTPFSGSLAHQSALVSGEHQHYFYGASSLFSINTGDTLFAYVYLDPSAPPTEVMLQWHDASNGWEHRAYWGGNTIPFGTDGTTSRKYMGALPAAGGWVRLNVPASAVGLEGISIDGMAFTLWNGRATWDKAGKSIP